jgi:DNA-binding response OmpR family regulator
MRLSCGQLPINRCLIRQRRTGRATQFDLLAAFVHHPGRVLTRRTLVNDVWGDLDAADPANQTAPGVGYRFVPSPDPLPPRDRER